MSEQVHVKDFNDRCEVARKAIMDYTDEGRGDAFDVVCLMIEKRLGRAFTVKEVNDVVDAWVKDCWSRKIAHPLADLVARDAAFDALTRSNAWEQVLSQSGKLLGWRWTKWGVAVISGLDVDLPAWVDEVTG